jgi:hypothetical protein
MVMVDIPVLASWRIATADRATPTLRLQNGVVLLQGESVGGLEVESAASERALSLGMLGLPDLHVVRMIGTPRRTKSEGMVMISETPIC